MLVILRASAKLEQSKERARSAEGKSKNKNKHRPYDDLLADSRHNIATTLANARYGIVVCVCTSVSVLTRIGDGVHHEIDSLLARTHASQLVRCRRLDERTAAALASRAIDRQCLERGKVRSDRACRVAGICTIRLCGRRRGR